MSSGNGSANRKHDFARRFAQADKTGVHDDIADAAQREWRITGGAIADRRIHVALLKRGEDQARSFGVAVDRVDEVGRRGLESKGTVELDADDLVGHHDDRIGRTAKVALLEIESRAATIDARQLRDQPHHGPQPLVPKSVTAWAALAPCNVSVEVLHRGADHAQRWIR